MSDEEDPLVTKPFKFVTGKSPFNGLDALLLMLFAAGILLSFSSTFSKKKFVSLIISTAWRHYLALCIAPTDRIVIVRLRRQIP